MGVRILSNDELSQILNLSPGTTRIYLSNYNFADFRSKLKVGKHTKDVYTFCRPFIYKLCDMLILKKQFKALERLENYCDKEDNSEDVKCNEDKQDGTSAKRNKRNK